MRHSLPNNIREALEIFVALILLTLAFALGVPILR